MGKYTFPLAPQMISYRSFSYNDQHRFPFSVFSIFSNAGSGRQNDDFEQMFFDFMVTGFADARMRYRLFFGQRPEQCRNRRKRKNQAILKNSTIPQSNFYSSWGPSPEVPGFAVHQIQVAGGLQPLAFRGFHTRHRLAEKGLEGLPGILWDSTSP